MKFDIKIQNFGKIKEANIKLRPFTVIAGANASGKSFITKAVYSFFKTVGTDYLLNLVIDQIDEITRSIQLIDFIYFTDTHASPLSQQQKDCWDAFKSSISLIKDDLIKININNQFYDISFIYEYILITKEKFKDFTIEINQNTDINTESSNAVQYNNADAHLKVAYEHVRPSLDQINSAIEQLEVLSKDPVNQTISAINNSLTNELQENFQVSKVSELKNTKMLDTDNTVLDFGRLGSVTINDTRLSLRIEKNNMADFHKFHNVIYLESPIYWKLKDALDNLRIKQTLENSKKRRANNLLGVPKHFYDVYDLMKAKPKINDQADYINKISQNIKEAINGKIQISDSGEFSFNETGLQQPINLHLTASGITNLGIISLLLERNIIGEGSYIFIDEPEVNLHPYWQRIMIETLFELSKNSINVVIASHSMDMMKCIEVLMESNPKLLESEHFGINQLSNEGFSIHEESPPYQALAHIKNDLGKSFYEMSFGSEIL